MRTTLFRMGLKRQNSMMNHRLEYALSLYFSATTVLGFFFEKNISFENMSIWQMLIWIGGSLALTELIRRMLRLLCNAIAERAAAREDQSLHGNIALEKPKGEFLFGRPALCFLFSFAMVLICWLPVWLAYYPGFWNYDPWQADMVITGVYSKHHPLLHTLLLGNCYKFALTQGNANLAPMLYSAIQGGICAAVFALCCVFIRRNTKGNIPYVLCLLFFALFAVHPILAMSTTKDTLFSAMILLACLLFLFMEGRSEKRKQLLMIAEIPVLALILLFRNNAKYCFFLLILLCLFQLKKTQWRRILAILTAGTILGVVIDRGLGIYLRATPVTIAEMCSVPSQMAGRVNEMVDDPEPETEAFLREFYRENVLSYNPYLADGTKRCIHLESRADLIRYIQESLKMFQKYPALCLDSFLYTTEGLWDLRDISHTRIYGTQNRQGYLPTTVQPGYQITLDSRLPFLERLLERLFTENLFMKVPILHFLFAPALYVDLVLLCLCLMIRGGVNRKRMLIPLFLLFLIFTIALGPGILPRYIYPLMVSAPLLIWMSMKAAASKTDRAS